MLGNLGLRGGVSMTQCDLAAVNQTDVFAISVSGRPLRIYIPSSVVCLSATSGHCRRGVGPGGGEFHRPVLNPHLN